MLRELWTGGWAMACSQTDQDIEAAEANSLVAQAMDPGEKVSVWLTVED